ncbi:MAG: choice-of-anchor X domain-containing protein, partial [Phycisphaerae bacterium]
GCLLSDDTGGTWRPLPMTSPDKMGVVRQVAWRPDVTDAFYLATESKGIWATTDGGETFRQIASKQTHLASDRVEGMLVWPDDPQFRTLYAFHGKAAAGISRSHDGGETWRVIAGDYHVRRIVGMLTSWSELRRTLVVASARSAPDLETVFACSSLDGLWAEAFRDVVYTDAAMAFCREHIYLATADRGLRRLKEAGAARVGPPEVNGYASVGVTWGPRADKELIYAYEPRRLGMVVSTDGMKTFTTQSRGLYVGPFVKEGAHIRANANGLRFFAAVNGSLYTGFVRGGGVSVAEASVTPAIFTYERLPHQRAVEAFREELYKFPRAASATAAARGLLERYAAVRETCSADRIEVTARAFAPLQKPKSVTVDLSELGGPAAAAMYDDGNHGDGGAGDSVYGVAFRIDPQVFYYRRDDPKRLPLAVHGLSIKATAGDDAIGGAVAVLSVYDRPDMLVFWADGRDNPLKSEAGEVTIVKRSGPSEALYGQQCMKFQTGDKPWCVYFGDGRRPKDVAVYHALSFWVRSDGAGELNVRLRDAPEFDYARTTGPVPIVGERLIQGGKITNEYRCVVIPMARLLAGEPDLRIGRLGYILFSGDARPPATFWIDRVVFHVNAESVEKELRSGGQDGEPGARRRR